MTEDKKQRMEHVPNLGEGEDVLWALTDEQETEYATYMDECARANELYQQAMKFKRRAEARKTLLWAKVDDEINKGANVETVPMELRQVDGKLVVIASPQREDANPIQAFMSALGQHACGHDEN